MSIPVERRYSRRFVFVVDRRSGEPGWTGRVRLSWYHPTVELSPGQRWQLTVRLKRPRGFMNPGGFDYEGWLFQQQIGATGYVRVSDQSRLLDDSSGQFVPRVRARILGFIDTVLQGHEQRGTVSALAIGYRHSISPGQWTVLRNTGTNHLMAISGLHIGLVAGGGFFCVLWLWSCIPGACLVFAAPRAAAIAAMLAAVFYAGLADFSIPTQRALVMITLVMLNIIAGRRSAPTSVLAAAALGVLVIDPFSVLAPGFWLSFAAVAVILLAVCGRSAFASTGWENWWWRWGRLQTIVAVGLAPLTLVFFSQISVIAPLANAVAVPWVGLVVVPLTLGGIGLMPVSSDISGLFLIMAAEALEILWWGLAYLEGLDLIVDTVPAISLWVGTGLVILTALWLVPPGVPGRWLGIFVLPLLFLRPSPILAPGSLELTVLDVGQGLAVVVRTHRHVLVFDAGPRYSPGFDTGDMVVVPFLRSRSIRKLDVLLISHADNDHSGGAASVVRAIETGQVLTNAPLSLPRVKPCLAGANWEWDGIRFEVLGPVEASTTDTNNGSCVLSIVTPNVRILLPGDIEKSAENELLGRLDPSQLRADILVAPHHGSRTSSGSVFLDAVRPRHVVFSVGFRNRFGFPHPDVMARYSARGVALHDTMRDGAITFTLTPDERLGPPVRFRFESKRFWNQ